MLIFFFFELKKIDTFCDVGAEDDAYFVSMLSGYIGSFLSIISSIFLNNYKGIKIFNYFNPNYNESKLEFSGKIIVEFNLIAVILSLLSTFKATKKIKRG